MKKTKQTSTQPCSRAELKEALKVLEGRWKILILFHLQRTGAAVLGITPRGVRDISEDADSAIT
jgi:DNA-binding HxlR family transcriptional regulator